MTQNDQSTGISRRTVTKAMAWAVPTIAVAAAVPAQAASIPTPEPGDNCKSSGGGSQNTFHFYIAQPSQVGDIITLSGAQVSTTTIIDNGDGCGVTVGNRSVSGTEPNVVVTYEITAIDVNVAQPYIAIEQTNNNANTGIDVNQLRGGGNIGSWTFFSNTSSCASIGWPTKGC